MEIHNNTKFPSDRLWLLGLVLIAFVAISCRIFSWEHFAWTKGGVPFSDSRALDMWAVNILDGIGFRDRVAYWLYEAFRMPFLSVVLAAIYAMFGYDYVPAKIILCGLSVATCLGVAGIGRLLFTRSVGFIAGCFCALYYPMIFYSHALMTETLSIFLFVLGVYMLLRSLHERSWGFIVGSGIAIGLAGLTRFSIFAVGPVLFFYLITFSSSWSRKLKLGIIWIAFILISFSPWIIRNAMIFDTFFPSGSGGSRMLWTGANPKYGGTTFSGEAWRDILWAVPDASEIQRDKRIKKEFVELIRTNPTWYIEKVNLRANQYLEIPSFERMQKIGGLYRYWTDLSVILGAWLGSIGFILAILKNPRSGLFIGGMFAFLLVLHSLAGEAVRYRLVSEWIWLIGAAYTVSMLSQFFKRSFLKSDKSDNLPIRDSLFDNRFIQWAVPIVLILPFSILAVQIPGNRELKRKEQLPVLHRSVDDVLRTNGLIKQYKAQKNVLHDIDYYKSLAFSQSPDKVSYPRDVVIFSGEISHIVCDRKRKVDNFSMKVNKAGGNVGDAQLICVMNKKVPIILPERIQKLKRAQGIVIGTILKAGPLGDFVIQVSDIIIDGKSLKG